ncbi:hypothetical protein OJAV_G00083930 [Oryzias javanicus]|uniref:Linker for activation of T-cells family member 1 n=1 Tax=Oryzias javanicus TaxID=123683 RepID=A0A437D4L6_ORYJA|nr:hypothetical protein OJAV_G00083930 [Oryzias javanicus]
MEVSWLLLLVSVAVLAAIFLLLVVCVDCSNQGPMAHISQRAPSEDDMSNPRFIVIHPGSTLPVLDGNAAHTLSVPVSPYPTAAEPGSWRPTTPTETESNPSYENSGTPPARPESDGNETGYILVLPESDPEKSCASMANSDEQDSSSSSSSDNLHEYVNVGKSSTPLIISKGLGSASFYQPIDNDKLKEANKPRLLLQDRPLSRRPSYSDDDDDDDDDDSNYVNQPPINHS